MEGLRRLTQLYSDTKKSCDVVAKEGKAASRDSELIDLHLKYRIQRERLSSWGLGWSDENAAEEGSIDEEVARAGLTSTVGDVLQNILQVLEKAEHYSGLGLRTDTGIKSSEKLRARHDDTLLRWSQEDRAQYKALAEELTNSIDLLYDLSQTRRELRQGTYLTGKGKAERPITPPPPPPAKSLFTRGTYSESEETLINPSRASTSKTLTSMELPSRLDPSLLELDDEQPPPYDSIGATQSSRMIAYLKQPQFPSSSSTDDMEVVKIPVLVEFAPFDPAYRATGISPPSQRLDALLAFYARTSLPFDGLPTATLSCLGFFEDPKDARYGLVYELPKASVGSYAGVHAKQRATPSSLLKVLQASSRTLNKATNTAKPLPVGPALEDRFRMAFNLVHAFSRMHVEENLTHKDINSGNIIFFQKTDSEDTDVDIRTPFITSYDLFSEFNLEKPTPSPIARHLYRTQDDPKVSNHGCSACKPQVCNCSPYRFDIYSLALVLLEIGLWLNIADLFKQKYTFENFKHRIDTIWVKRLSNKCGTTYMKVVEEMLTKSCANIAESDLLGCYNKWLSMLQKCCSIDETEDPFPIVYARIHTPPSLANSRTQSWSPKASQKGFPKAPTPTTLPFAITESKEDEDSTVDAKIPTIYKSAAKTILRAWRSRRSISTTPFQDYKQKVSLIQTRWRQRREIIASQSLNSSRDIVIQSEVVREVQTEHSMIHIERTMPTRAKLRIYNVKLQPETLDMWHDELQPRLERVVGRALRSSPESASMELLMVGESEATCRPTIFVTCTSTSKVRGALSRRFSYDSEIFDLKVRKGKIRRSKATRTQRSPPPAHRSMVDDGNPRQMPLNPFHQKRPLCGASIGAFVAKHLPPVSFGGIVDVDGELFGMTVHHLLDDPSDDDDDESVYEHQAESGATRSIGRHGGLDDFVRELGGHPTLQSYPTDSMFPLEISDDEEESFSEDDEDEQDSSDAGYESEEGEDDKMIEMEGTQGDISGIVAGTQCDILVTQPALDDVDEHFFPCEEDKDEDHIDSHTLGHVYASSGIKRWNRNGVLHEIDWALLKLDDDRMQPCNLVQGGKRYCQTDPDSKRAVASRLVEPVCRGSYNPDEDEYPTQVAPSEDLHNLAVHCFGRTSGLQGGCIGPAMSSVRIYKRRSFSRSWYVMGDFGGELMLVSDIILRLLTSLQLAVTLVLGSLITRMVKSADTYSPGASETPLHIFVLQTSSWRT